MADNANKLRSPSKEKALDTRIREIQLRSKEREERQRVIQNEAKTVRQVKVKENETELKANGGNKPKNSTNATANKKQQSSNQTREWDKGKSPAAEWKTNVPEMNDRRRAKQLPSSSTNRRNGPGPKPQNSNPNKPVAGFQHDDRFVDKPANAHKEKTPDENRKPSGTQQSQKTGQPAKRSVFSRVTRTNQKGDPVPFQKRTPYQVGNRFRRQNPFKNGQPNNEKTPNDGQSATNQSNTPNRRRRFQNRNNNKETEATGTDEKVPQRQHRNNKPLDKTSNQKATRKTAKIRPNKRPLPDHVQVRQVVRQLIGKVCMLERREQLGMPKVEKESEV